MAYTATNWVEGVTTLGPTNMNKIETELVYLDTRIPPAAVAYGTSLPGSPVDGQTAILVDSTTNPSYQWAFRYNGGSSSSYKWEFVGGTAWTLVIPDYTTTGTGAWQAASGAGNVLTIPRAGDYDFTLSAFLSGANASIHVLGILVAGASPPPLQCNASMAANGNAALYTRRPATGVSAGQTVGPGYYSVTATGTFGSLVLAVTPKRVS